jgi:hypothetical protein
VVKPVGPFCIGLEAEFGYQVVERHAPVTGQTAAGFLFQPDLAGLRLGVRLVGPDRG